MVLQNIKTTISAPSLLQLVPTKSVGDAKLMLPRLVVLQSLVSSKAGNDSTRNT